MRWLATALLGVLCGVGSLAGQVPDWPLPAVLSRTATYVENYGDRIAGLVVEESYVQDVQVVNRFGYRVNLGRGPTHRTLKSDLLLVRNENSDAWMQIRDVFEVDGKPVRDHSDRLQKLFTQSKANWTTQADKIMRESTRHNIGDIERTINMPILAMAILDRSTQTGFQFVFGPPPDTPTDLPTQPAFVPPPGALVVGFTEQQVRSLITSPQGKNLKSRGRFWITVPGGEVMMSELRVDDFTVAAIVHVAYQAREGFSAPVPVEMHETYTNRLNSSKVEGHATYTNFRQFGVKTDYSIRPPAPQGGL